MIENHMKRQRNEIPNPLQPDTVLSINGPFSSSQTHTKRAKHDSNVSSKLSVIVPEEKSLSNMSKQEISEWKKDMRRVRNRVSAAASRQKVRNRIVELENEVNYWKAKYAALVESVGKNFLVDGEISLNSDSSGEKVDMDGLRNYNISVNPSPVTSNTMPEGINASDPSQIIEPKEMSRCVSQDSIKPCSISNLSSTVKNMTLPDSNDPSQVNVIENLDDPELEEFLLYAFNENQ